MTKSHVAVQSDVAEQQRLCTFVVGALLVGLPVGDVSEVVRGEHLTHVPLAPEAVVGLLNLRGHIIPAVDARTRFGLESRERDDEATHVIVNVLGEQISLMVDRASDVVTVARADREDVPDTVSPTIRRLLASSYQRPDGLLLVLDPHIVLTDL